MKKVFKILIPKGWEWEHIRDEPYPGGVIAVIEVSTYTKSVEPRIIDE